MTVGDCTGCVSRSQQQEGSLQNIVAASDSSAGVSESQRHVGSLNNIVAARDTRRWTGQTRFTMLTLTIRKFSLMPTMVMGTR